MVQASLESPPFCKIWPYIISLDYTILPSTPTRKRTQIGIAMKTS